MRTRPATTAPEGNDVTVLEGGGPAQQAWLPDNKADATSARLRVWQRVALAVAAIEFLILYAPTMRWLYERWTLSVWHNAHGLLLVPVVGYFVYKELQPFASRPRASSGWGFAILVPALALTALDAGVHTELLAAVGLVAALPGLSLLLLGTARTRAILFPLGLLLFSLPIPLGITETIHWQLRQVVVAATSAIVPMLGIPLYVEGTTLHMAKDSLEVADACSGFSTLYAAMAVACLTAYTASTTRRRALVLLAAAPIAIASNILRVVLLVVLVVWRGQDILHTSLHPLSGMLTFALSLPLIFWLGGDPSRGARA
jgi:exosortase